jgi:hypothetical protein
MNKLESIQKDINKLEKALREIEKTENHVLFQKSILIKEICKNIRILEDKQENIKKLLIA